MNHRLSCMLSAVFIYKLEVLGQPAQPDTTQRVHSEFS